MLTNKISPELIEALKEIKKEELEEKRMGVKFNSNKFNGVLGKTPITPNYDQKMDNSNIQNIHINKDYFN